MIVGAGVVGCYLGKKLGDCVIWDKNKQVEEKACSSLVSKRGLESLGIDFKDCVQNQVRGAKIFSEKNSLVIERKSAQAYVIDRLGFQKRLALDALDNGCSILFDKAWNGEQDDFVVGADGAFSAVARSCGVKRKYVFAYQQKCELAEKKDADFVELHFGSFAPGFFGWLIPFGEKTVEIGVGCSSGNPKEFFDVFAKKFQVRQVLKVQSAPIPVFDAKSRTVFGNKALVGDAAGQVKATTGGGVVFGCKCAEVLADCLKKEDLAGYEKAWRKRCGRDLKIHAAMRRFLDKTNIDDLFGTIKKKRLDGLISEFGDMDSPNGLVFRVLRKPGLWPLLAKVALS